MAKIRLDTLLLDNQLAPTQEKAQFLIMSGNVLVNDQKIDKCGHQVKPDAIIRILHDSPKYVSRGAEKLAGAIAHFNIPVQDQVAMDIGISTGGFSDYLFQHGAKAIIGIDVGYGQLDLKIRHNPNLLLLERTNARNLTNVDLTLHRDKHPSPGLFFSPTLVVMDVSFISVTKILPIIPQLVDPNAVYVILIKPQFEAHKSEIGKGGIITDPAIHTHILDRVKATLTPQFTILGECDSPITGTKGNKEFFFYLQSL